MNLFYPSNSIFHYMHGFTKIVVFGILFTILPFLFDRIMPLIFYILFLLIVLIYIRPTHFHWMLLIPALSLAVIMSMTYFLSDMGGDVYFQTRIGYWDIQVSENNVQYAVTFMLRMLSWSLVFFVLLFTTSPQDLVAGMNIFRVPEFLTLSLSLTFRYWSLMITDTKIVMDAQYCRGVDLRSGSLWTRLPRFMGLIVPVIFIFLKRFRTTSFSLSLKGVGRKNARTRYYHPRLTKLDYWSLTLGGLLFVLLFIGALFFDW